MKAYDPAVRERAQKLRAEGMQYEDIASVLGVVKSTAYRWCNETYEERQRQSSREAKRRRRRPCSRCGTAMSYDNLGEICWRCEDEDKNGKRRRRIIAASIAGLSHAEIAEREGMQRTAVETLISYWRLRKGLDLPLRRARNRTHWAAIQELWAEGCTVREIGDRLDIPEGSVSVYIATMRKAGLDVPRRSVGRVAA